MTTARAAIAAAVTAAATFVASGIIRGTYPFGDVTRSTNDLGQQVIPMYAHLRDILTGQAPGDLLFNWSGGFGVPFLGDIMAYLGTTLWWIVLLLPRDRIDLAVFVITAAALALAAGAMTTYLRRLRPTGPAWLAATAGVSYATCAWAIDDAAYMTVWLNGMVAFPVLCLLCEWILQRRSIPSMLVTPFVVALMWTSHFYTVYMATIGAAIVVLARVLSYEADVSWRHRLSGVLRCLFAMAAGIGLAAPLLVPTFWLVRQSRPSPSTVFHPISSVDFLSRLLPGSEGVGSTPGLAVGTLMLLLAVSFPLNRAVRARERIVWTSLVGLAVLSMQVRFPHEVWHGFDPPNGSPFRQAFVIAGLLVIVGWMSAASRPRSIVSVAIPLVLVFALYAVAYDARTVTATTHLVVPIVAAVALLAWLLVRRSVPKWLQHGAAVLLVGAVLVEVTLSSVAIDQARSKILGAAPSWGQRHDEVRSLVRSAPDWPQYRVAPGAERTVNDPMLLGGQGPQYYSSTIPDDLSRELMGLGFGYTSYGRATLDPQNPVVDAVFSVGARVVSDDAKDLGLRLAKYDVAPLVTVRPAEAWSSNDPGPFGLQETALGSDVYAVPAMKPQPAQGIAISDQRPGALKLVPVPGAAKPIEVRFTGSCRPGSEIYLWAPTFVGEVLEQSGDWEPVLLPVAKRPGLYTGAPMRKIGTTGANGVVELAVRINQQAQLPISAIGCLDRDRLTAAVGRLSQSKPAVVNVGGHSVDVRLNRGTAGTVVLGVVRIPGWRCSVDGGPNRTPGTRGGLIAIPVGADATDLSCIYRPTGTVMGLAIGATALLVIAALAGVLALRRRQRQVAEPEKTTH
ncbi:YfhO family protein [Kribbella catacumbae]|uniref:YfhO family protein n=1 Tax=Kribbella catacumbae TaxID=460086 RepID=UPI000379EC10|nr:YfhO family protein [Kribbella catacumbae]